MNMDNNQLTDERKLAESALALMTHLGVLTLGWGDMAVLSQRGSTSAIAAELSALPAAAQPVAPLEQGSTMMALCGCRSYETYGPNARKQEFKCAKHAAPQPAHEGVAGEPDNWQQYAKEGETAQACIERHRREQDALLKLLAQARTPLSDHEIIALIPAGWTGMLAQVMQLARRIERAIDSSPKTGEGSAIDGGEAFAKPSPEQLLAKLEQPTHASGEEVMREAGCCRVCGDFRVCIEGGVCQASLCPLPGVGSAASSGSQEKRID
jgi:hypothetical protein